MNSKNILNIENEILQVKDKVSEFMQNTKEKTSLDQLRTDLKYLAILTSKSKLNSKEYEKTIEFLREHYNFLQSQLAFTSQTN